MGKLVFHWKDPEFRFTHPSDTYRFVAIAGIQSFAYLVLNAAGVPVAVKSYAFDRKYHFFDKPLKYLGEVTAEEDLLYADFTMVQIAVRGVPFAPIQPENADHHSVVSKLKEITDLTHADEIYSDLTGEGINVAFALPDIFSREAYAWYHNASIIHCMSALMISGLKYSGTAERPVVLLNVLEDFMEFLVCNSGKLLFANHYRITGAEDVMYYLLAVLKSLQLTNDTVDVRCMGIGAHATHRTLQAYFPHLGFYPLAATEWPAGFPVTEAADLLSVSQCAS